MSIYYNSSFYGKSEGQRGFKQQMNYQFEYVGSSYLIPAVYRFQKGIVFDVINILDETKMKEFFEKYKDSEENLSSAEQICANQENPHQSLSLKDVCINGEPITDGWSSSGFVSVPWENDGKKIDSFKKNYASVLKDVACFACQRFCIPYNKTESKFKKLLRFLRLEKIKSIGISTYPVELFLPLNLNFKISNEETEKQIDIQHPMTGNVHKLYFQDKETVEIPLHKKKTKLYSIQMSYEIEPELPECDVLQFDSSMQYTEQAENEYSPKASSAIGIIGGADGPTAVFLGTNDKSDSIPCGAHGLPLHYCFSKLWFQKNITAHFIIEGINTKIYGSKSYIIHP